MLRDQPSFLFPYTPYIHYIHPPFNPSLGRVIVETALSIPTTNQLESSCPASSAAQSARVKWWGLGTQAQAIARSLGSDFIGHFRFFSFEQDHHCEFPLHHHRQ